MKRNCLCVLLLALLTSERVAAQSENELQIPEENDNQFPLDIQTDPEGQNVIDGSGAGALEEPAEAAPPLEEAVPAEPAPAARDALSCPAPCVCNTEGDSDFTVDCSGYDLTEFPASIDPRTTILKLQKNKLTEIPKEISTLKNLKILNASNNSIMKLAAGSVSELNELTVLQLANNRLIEYPQDLKNSFGLIKLREIDLGGNDMRTELTADNFKNFESLTKITLPATTTQFAEELCATFLNKLGTVCIESCNDQSIDCPGSSREIEDEFEPVLPGTLNSPSFDKDQESDDNPASEATQSATNDETEINKATTSGSNTPETSSNANSEAGDRVEKSEISFRSAVSQMSEGAAQLNVAEDAPAGENSIETDVKIGAKTESKPGGVDKSVIGLVVAGMIVVVAGITIKKNWSSIKKRFSSTPPQAANERAAGNANGVAPEEVPLQDKSPV